MPTFEIPIQIEWTGASGSPGVNVWHGRTDGGIPDPSDPGIGDCLGFIQAFYNAVKAYSPLEVGFRFLGEVTGVGASSGESQTYDPWLVAGSGNAAFLPPANCALFSWKTPTGGRSGKGRTFLGPLTVQASNEDGKVATTALGVFQAAADELIASSSGIENGALGVYSRTDNLFRDFTSCTVRSDFSVLRSRRD